MNCPYTLYEKECSLRAELVAAREELAKLTQRDTERQQMIVAAIAQTAELAKLRALCDSKEFHDLMTIVAHYAPLGSMLHYALMSYETRKAAGRGEGME